MTSARILYRACEKWVENQDSRMGAALAYYTVFSIAPILVIVLAVAGLLVDTTTLSEAIVGQVRMLVGDPGAALLRDLLDATRDTARGGLAAALALVALIVGATTAFAELKDGLDELFCGTRVVPEGIWATLRARLLSFAGRPIGEPVARRGPFVMNTEEELDQAVADYRSGRLVGG